LGYFSHDDGDLLSPTFGDLVCKSQQHYYPAFMLHRNVTLSPQHQRTVIRYQWPTPASQRGPQN